MPQAVAYAAKFVADVVVKFALAHGASVQTALQIAGVAKAGVELAAVLAISAATTPGIAAAGGTPLDFKADPQAGIPLVIGRTATAGNIVYQGASGSGNDYLSYITVLSLGECEGIESFSANGDVITFAANEATGYFANIMWQYQQLGTDAEPAFSLPHPPFAVGQRSEWTADHKLSGLCATDWILKFAAKKYYTGTPKPRWIVLGPVVYDPRADSTQPGGSGSQRADDPSTWDFAGRDNPYLQAITWALGRKSNGIHAMGLDAPPSMIDWSAYTEGANVCDANDWKVGGIVYSTDSKWEVMKAILQAGGGKPIPLGGLISCTVQAPRVSIATLTGADVDGEPSFQRSAAIRDRINRSIPRYRSEDHDWEIVPADPVAEAAFITADGRQRTQELDFPLVQQLDQTHQLAQYAIWDSREEGPYTLPLIPKWMGLKPGDCITLDEPEFSLGGARKLIVLTRHRDLQTGSRTITCRTENDDKHTAILGAAGSIAAFAAANPGDPSIVYPPQGSVSTDRLDDLAAHAVGGVYSNSTVTQATQGAGTNFGNNILTLTVDTTGEPVLVDFHVLDDVTSGSTYYYYLHVDSTFSIPSGTTEVNHFDELPEKTGTANDIIQGRAFRWLITGLSAGSHTFRIYLRNLSGASISVYNRSLILSEMKKST